MDDIQSKVQRAMGVETNSLSVVLVGTISRTIAMKASVCLKMKCL